MGLVDKFKEQASQVATKAQEAGRVGQAKIDAMQARRRADDRLREIGLMAFRGVDAASFGDGSSRVESLYGELRDYESQYGTLR